MQKPELHLPPRRYEHELMTNRITALGLWPVPDSWAQALEKGTPEAIARVVEKKGHEQTLADIVETMEGQGYEFDRILRREQVVIGRVSEGRQHTEVARWRNDAAERATAARNVFHVGLLEVGAGAYELRRGVDGVMRLPINYARTVDTEVFHPNRPAHTTPEAPIADEDLDADDAAPAKQSKNVETLDTKAWSEKEFEKLKSRLAAHGWLFECGLPLTERDGWHAQRWGGTQLVALRRENDEPETPAETGARVASELRIWCEPETPGVEIVPMPAEARWFETIEEMREDATHRLTDVGESSELQFSCWNTIDNEDETLGFQPFPLRNDYAPERVTTAFTDRRHVCVYINGYYAYTLCDGPEEEAGETALLFMNSALPPKSTALAELRQLVVCRCDDNRFKPATASIIH